MEPVYNVFLREVIGLVRGIRKRFDAGAAVMGLTYARAQALLHIAENEGLTQAELAEMLDIRTPPMNRTLDQLEQSGLIERRSDPTDKRVRRLFLTPEARAQAAELLGFIGDLRRDAYQDIPPEELAQALATLRRIQQNIDRRDGDV
ncbi:MarR family winged helix-turn-helix transcriptional regulator [Pseudodonghicola flavimaris]|uniref:MarR family transcriptional regulator n=1 Tax=Pseudodonghicola flavimaris TaxID=3050036 RepID=A0ABT7F099_9RHOB|nr:MarR family transcriptional regulator [Pseudodonghicola flavimaris]MDK3018039.1 MarR family transcriptional regulator [Pseudodonghicola flavimaris]